MDMLQNLEALSPAVAVGGITLFFIREYVKDHQNKKSIAFLPPPPPHSDSQASMVETRLESFFMDGKSSHCFYFSSTFLRVAGLPVIGNLLQLKEKKPHKTFTKWAEKYGPIYSIKAGSTTMVVLNSNHVAKEAMVAKFSSISTRKLSNALKILTSDKSLVSMSDYDDFYKDTKRRLLASTLGPNAQKRHRIHRNEMINNICHHFHAHTQSTPSQAVNFRNIFQSEIFRLSMKQAIGEDVESIYVEEMGSSLSRQDMHKILVVDPMAGAIDVDWRDFFPFFNWLPNPGFDNRINDMYTGREAVMKALIGRQKKRISSGKEMNCFLDHLLSEEGEGRSLSEEEILMLVWEDIIEGSDTTLVATEWAIYELSRNPNAQNRLLSEIRKACGSNRLTEEKLCQLPYLAAVFHETLRKHSPVPIVPLRYVHRDTELGGFRITEGTQIAINIYGCNMDKKVWESPEEWKPERFDDDGCMELHKTMAFGGGKRACAGAQQAMTISCMAIGRLVQEFQWRLGDGEEEKVDTVGLTTHKLHPLLSIITPRLLHS